MNVNETKAANEKQTLAELLQSNKKDVMLQIAAKHQADVKKSHTKGKIAETMVPAMVDNFKSLLNTISQDEFDTLQKIIHSSNEETVTFNDQDAKILATLAELGYLYMEDQQEFEPYLPIEMIDCIKEIDRSGQLEEQMEESQELAGYLTALVRLYGIYPISQLVTVWNQYHEEPLTEAEVAEKAELLAKWQTEYTFAEGIVYSLLFKSLEEVHIVMDRLQKIPYYMPTEAEIAYYAEHTVNIDSPNYLNLKNYFDAKSLVESTKAEALYTVAYGSAIGTSGKSINAALESLGVFFESKQEINEFGTLFKELDDNTRKWDRHGFKPLEMRTDKEKEKNTKQTPITVHKIGRNEPCPCGSGKKYKKCHGRNVS